MTAAAVEVIPAAGRQRGVACLTLAFAADPVMRWCWPDPHRYATYWPPFAEAFGGRAFDHGTAYGIEDCRAVALWMRHGVEPDEAAVIDLIAESTDKPIFKDVNGLFEQMGELHPAALVSAADRRRPGRAGPRPGLSTPPPCAGPL